jgi:Microcystin-dependent protein
VPPGAIMDFAGAAAPGGWLLCDGSLISRTINAALFAAIGTVYGAGDGSTTFALPDCRGRVTAGPDGGTGRLSTSGAYPGGVTTAVLGATGGEQGHILSVGELAAHAHGPPYANAFLNANTGDAFWTNIAGGPTNIYYSNQTGLTGSNSTHNNTQPTIIVNKIIKT